MSEKTNNAKINNEQCIGLSNNEIFELLNIDRYELEVIASEFYENKEVNFYAMYGIKRGLSITTKGTSSYSTKKYLKRYKSENINKAKDLVTIIIPVISVIISLIILYTSKSEVSDMKQQQILIEKTQDSIGNRLNQMNEFYINQTSDSLKK
ncbi:hypothetical protein BXQ17_08010 [Polaribacter sp. BM10]|nr:hypothetical protein BXQ17_07990 [Polaribacter sp. BM10]AQS94010.1 hypothetical protein BXQ17_08010 [Polaribacter sp. BM10]